MRIFLVAALLTVSAPARSLPAQTSFCARLRTLTAGPAVAEAHWGISVSTLSGQTLCAIDDAKLFRPASNNKLLTTAAAFALLGPDRTVETPVLGRLDPTTGIVTGDLTLVGAADGNLDSGDLPYLAPASRPAQAPPFRFHDLEDLAAQLKAAGVRAVTGDLVGFDALLPNEPYPPSWNADDLVWGYGAPVSALSIADNQLRLTVFPGQPGSPATAAIDDHGIPWYTLQTEVKTVPRGTSASISVERLPGSRVLRVFGTVAEGAPDTEQVAIDEPALYAATAFRRVLSAQGITVGGITRAQHTPVTDATSFLTALHGLNTAAEKTVATGMIPATGIGTRPPTLASHTSAPLADDVTFTMKTSQNLHAELLLRRLSASGFPESNVEGASMVRAFLLHAGITPGDFILYDGSGLSDHDLVAPRAFTQLLVYAATQPWFARWRATLPVGGVDGSLAGRFTGPLKGRVQAKTGTLGESRALSGFVTTASGRTLVFSILVDNHLPGSSADRAAMDRMVEAIAGEP